MNLVVLAPGLLLAAILAAPAATPLSANLDARPLNHAETATYLPLICSGKISKGDGFDHNCQALFEYSASHAEGAGSYNLSLSSIIHGHLTDPISDQAFVSYSSDFESEATNSGGGILFQNGPAGWRLVRWYPGENFDGCLQLNPTGKAKMLCLFFIMGRARPAHRFGCKRCRASIRRMVMVVPACGRCSRRKTIVTPARMEIIIAKR